MKLNILCTIVNGRAMLRRIIHIRVRKTGGSAFHLGTAFVGVANDFFACERDCERVWTPSRSGSSASCDCVGVSAITCRCGVSSRPSA